MDSTPELNAALAKAQEEFPAINKEKTAKAGNYSYNYASLDAFLNACRPVLAKHGIALVQPFEIDGDMPVLLTELRHTSGEVISSRFPLLRRPETDQQLGSTLTYLRRYTLAAMLGVAAEEDVDGDKEEKAEAKPAGRKRAAAARSQPPPSSTPLEPSQEQRDAFYKPQLITDQQRGLLYTLFTQKGITERENQLAFCTQALGRTIGSSKEIGKAEATAVIRQLEEWDPENPQTFPKPASG
jgi:hypothetical protein